MNVSRVRLDKHLVALGLVPTRSQAESYIRLGKVSVNKRVVTKPGTAVVPSDKVVLNTAEQYVSRAGLKLASIAERLDLDFDHRVVLDVGSSTGGFTDYALRHGASKVIAVDVGTDQLHPTLRDDSRLELHEKTDIRDFIPQERPDLVVIDVSFISLREILPHLAGLMSNESMLVAMVKPQFEAKNSGFLHKGVVKNEKMRRQILTDFENWAKQAFVILTKADSQVAGEKGNLERFYLLKKLV